MDDYEIIKRCATKIGLSYQFNTKYAEYPNTVCLYDEHTRLWNIVYNPLWNNQQAMELLIKFKKSDSMKKAINVWMDGNDDDLNRVISECVANLSSVYYD